MILYDKLTKVFDTRWFLLKYNGGTFCVKEQEAGASVKEIVFEYHGQLMSIHKDIFNKTDFLYKDDADTERGMPPLKHGCDAVLVIERREERFIVFVELHPIETERLTLIQKKMNTKRGALSRFERQCLKFSKNGPANFPVNRMYSQLYKLPIKDHLFFDELPTFHVKVNRNAEQGKFNLDSILKLL